MNIIGLLSLIKKSLNKFKESSKLFKKTNRKKYIIQFLFYLDTGRKFWRDGNESVLLMPLPKNIIKHKQVETKIIKAKYINHIFKGKKKIPNLLQKPSNTF